MKLFFTMARQHVRSESDGRVGREDMELMEMPRTISISSSATAPIGRGRSVDETIEMNQKEVELAATNRDLIARRKADMIAARTPFLSSRSRARLRAATNETQTTATASAVKMSPPEGSWQTLF